jgi:eukaryotic-like serine/threonine-protein kinase
VTTSAEPGEARVLAVLDEYMAALRAGRAPDRSAILALHPDLAESLAASFRALDFVHAAGSTLEPPEAPPAGEEAAVAGRVLGDYRLLREIGRGGMAVVYEAEQISLGRHVALKVLPFAAVLDPKHLQRFKNEAQAAAHLNHPHIVPVHAVGCERGVHYYAMQYVEGQSLAVAIREMKGGGPGEGPRTPISSHGSNRQSGYIRMAAALGVQAAEALDHAHQLGIVHRDVKPGNLLVDLAGTLWITDFGLSQSRKDVGLTITGELLGTIRYMSPEQALAKRAPIDHRTDVYSLGATLYELFTLEPAFPGDDPHLVIQDITFREPVRPRRLNPALPRDVETVLLKAMSKDPAGRYATAQEMADDLERFLENRPVEAKRPGLLRRVAKWARRHRGIVGVAAAMLLLAVVGLATGATLLWQEKERTWNEKEQARVAFERAEANLQLALKALDEIFVDDAEGLPRIRQGLPRDLLRTGLGFYEALARGNADNREVSDFMGKARIGASRIYRELGEEAEADEAIDEAIATYREFALRWPDDPIPHNNLGIALAVKGDLDSAIREYREAIRLGPSADAHYNLGNALFEEDLEGAIREYRAAIRVEPNHANAYFNLANGLRAKGDLEGAIRAAREVVRLEPEDASAHASLAIALMVHGDLDEAMREYREAIRLKPDDPGAHYNLGSVLLDKGDPDGALLEYREATRLEPDSALPHYGLGNALMAKGALDEAIREYGETIRIRPDFAEAHGNLGAALMREGRFGDALPPLRRACELGSERPGWEYPTKADVLSAERLAALEGRLDQVLSGGERPRDAIERIGFARILCAKSRHAEAARMFAEAFAEDTALAEDISKGHRYNAACSASLAAAHGGSDAAEWRGRALKWLRADLAAQGTRAATLEHWKRDPDLAGVRDRLDDLPAGEREEWTRLWADVDALVARGPAAR